MLDGRELKRRRASVLSGCAGKERLERRVAVEVARRHGVKGRVAYRCPICRGWHVGTRDGGGRR